MRLKLEANFIESDSLQCQRCLVYHAKRACKEKFQFSLPTLYELEERESSLDVVTFLGKASFEMLD